MGTRCRARAATLSSPARPSRPRHRPPPARGIRGTSTADRNGGAALTADPDSLGAVSPTTRVFVARLAALNVLDPLGDQVGSVRDVVVHFSSRRRAPAVIDLVGEVPGWLRVFVPMTRVTSVDAGQVITTGQLNMSRFEQRTGETLVVAELFERTIRISTEEESFEATVEDIASEQEPNRDWLIVKVFARKGSGGTRSLSRLGRRRGETVLVDIHQVTGLQRETQDQSAEK